MGVRVNKGIPVEKTYPGAVIFAPNGLAKFDLDVNVLLEEINLQTTGTLTLAGYTANPTARVEALENLFSNVSFEASAKQNGAAAVQLTSVDMAYLRFKTNIISGTAPARTNIGVANGAYEFQTNATKYFGMKRINKVYDASYLDTRALQSLTLNLQCRDVNAMIVPGTGANGTATLTAAQVLVHSRGWSAGAMAKGKPVYVKETQNSTDLTNYAGLDKDFLNVPIGGIVTRQVFKTCASADGVNYADPVDGIIATTARTEGGHIKTTLTGNAGITTPFDAVQSVLQAQNKATYKLESWPAGYSVYEPSRTKNISDALNLTAAISCKNTADITFLAGKTNTLIITTEQVVSN